MKKFIAIVMSAFIIFMLYECNGTYHKAVISEISITDNNYIFSRDNRGNTIVWDYQRNIIKKIELTNIDGGYNLEFTIKVFRNSDKYYLFSNRNIFIIDSSLNIISKKKINVYGSEYISSVEKISEDLYILGSSKGSIYFWNLDNVTTVGENIVESEIFKICLSPKKSNVLTISVDGYATVWKRNEFSLQKIIHFRNAISASFISEEKIALGLDLGKIILIDISKETTDVLYQHDKGVCDLFYNKSKGIIVSSSLDEDIYIFNMRKKALHKINLFGYTAEVLDHNNNIFVAGTSDWGVITFNYSGRRLKKHGMNFLLRKYLIWERKLFRRLI